MDIPIISYIRSLAEGRQTLINTTSKELVKTIERSIPDNKFNVLEVMYIITLAILVFLEVHCIKIGTFTDIFNQASLFLQHNQDKKKHKDIKN